MGDTAARAERASDQQLQKIPAARSRAGLIVVAPIAVRIPRMERRRRRGTPRSRFPSDARALLLNSVRVPCGANEKQSRRF
jgi:hypothetical protein